MNRPRKLQRNLPPCVYFKHNAYWFVKKNKWRKLAGDLPGALREYAQLHAVRTNPMSELIADATPSVLRDDRGQPLAGSTQAQYKVALRRLSEILKDAVPTRVTARHVLQIRESFLPQVATANRVVIVLRKVFDYALTHGHVNVNPAVGIKALRQNVRKRRVTYGEFKAIQASAGPTLAVVMDLCFLTGQRISDVLNIKRSDLTPDGIEFQQMKTDARLVVAWNADLAAAVEQAKKLHGKIAGMYLVKGRFGDVAITYNTIYKQWRIACKAAGVEDADIHDLRAMSGTEAKQQGLDSQALLGHTDAKMTRRYLRAKDVPVVTGPRFGGAKK